MPPKRFLRRSSVQLIAIPYALHTQKTQTIQYLYNYTPSIISSPLRNVRMCVYVCVFKYIYTHTTSLGLPFSLVRLSEKGRIKTRIKKDS